MEEQILFIDMVPKPLWHQNLRKHLSQHFWRKLRKSILEKQGYQCAVCDVDISGSRAAVADEVWEYDAATSPAVARLLCIEGVCQMCDRTKHFGLTTRLIQEGTLPLEMVDKVTDHFCKLNGGTPEDFDHELKLAGAEFSELSQLDWTIDWGEFEDRVPPDERNKRFNAR